jgi:ABC-type Na+ efflux pump permease subunit
MEKMTITKGLGELKLLDSRISKAISSGAFVAAIQADKKINSRLTKDEFNKLANSAKESVDDLIKRRENIKKAIVKSNATTLITIGEVEMTVAEAIEYKASISYNKSLLSVFREQLRSAEVTIARGNEQADEKANAVLTAAVGKEGSKDITPEQSNTIYKLTYDRYKFELVDPLGIGKLIQDMDKKIDEFESNVDIELQTSNSTTYIEI